jgi:acyl carrier protein
MKIGDAKVDIKKVGKEFKVEIDGEHLDNYGSEKEAITMAKEFIKQYKG